MTTSQIGIINSWELMPYGIVRRRRQCVAAFAEIATSDGLSGDTTRGRESDTSSDDNGVERKTASQQAR
ncbi:MAG: hypothetical protein WCJ09_00235 [Planctomycetota bacterium]